MMRALSLSHPLTNIAARTTLGVSLFLYKSILLDAIIMCELCVSDCAQRLVFANARTRVRFHVLIKHKY